MNEDEDIAKLFLRVDEVVNIMLCLSETINKSVIVQKKLRSLPSKFNPKVSTIEETTNFDILNRDQLCGSLTAYEMRIPKGKVMQEHLARHDRVKSQPGLKVVDHLDCFIFT